MPKVKKTQSTGPKSTRNPIELVTCPACNGTGNRPYIQQIMTSSGSEKAYKTTMSKCVLCGGTGKVNTTPNIRQM